MIGLGLNVRDSSTRYTRMLPESEIAKTYSPAPMPVQRCTWNSAFRSHTLCGCRTHRPHNVIGVIEARRVYPTVRSCRCRTCCDRATCFPLPLARVKATRSADPSQIPRLKVETPHLRLDS